MIIFGCIYFSIGLLISLYIIICHLRATFMYFRQIYTAKHVRPGDIKTYFGTKYWNWFQEDDWGEILFMSTMMAILCCLGALIIWPGLIFFWLDRSIQNARERIRNDR